MNNEIIEASAETPASLEMHQEDQAWRTTIVQRMKRKNCWKWWEMKNGILLGIGSKSHNSRCLIIICYLFRVILVGGSGVGKTSLQEKFLSPENSQFYESVYGD